MRTPIDRAAPTSVPRGTQVPPGRTSDDRRKAQRELARRLGRAFRVSFDLAFKAVRARGRCVELTEAIGECRALAFCTAVQMGAARD